MKTLIDKFAALCHGRTVGVQKRFGVGGIRIIVIAAYDDSLF